jgi:hypothetical protein
MDINSKTFRVYNSLMQKNSNLLFRGVLKTPPIRTDPSAHTVLYTSLNSQSCRAYIAAAKSFLRFFPEVAVEVQDDGDLCESCREELRRHIIGITIHSKEEMDRIIIKNLSGRVQAAMPPSNEYYSFKPIKILYLKLFNTICRYSEKKVIFLDSDMLFLKYPKFIIEWIEKPYETDFYSCGKNTLAEKLNKIFKIDNFDIGDFNSGILGICGGINQEDLATILEKIKEKNYDLFHEWEIEQSIWAILFSKRNKPINFDSIRKRYIGNAWMSFEDLKKKSTIAHFVGAARFKNLTYLKLANDIFESMRRNSANIGKSFCN